METCMPAPETPLPEDTPRVERLLHAMSKDQLVEMLGDVFFVLFPSDDPNAEWDAGTAWHVAQVFHERGLVATADAYGTPARPRAGEDA